MEKEANQ